MRHIISFLSALVLVHTVAYSQNNEDYMDYRRSSLCSFLINHTDQKFASEIHDAFLEIPTPDKFNDHDLSVKVISLDNKLDKAGSSNENSQISDFLGKNKVASRLIGKWFNRDSYTGVCNMFLVQQRGLYNATEFDKQLAQRSARGMALLEDAGEDLIQNTFVLVNDIKYIDKQKTAKAAGVGLRVLGSLIASYTGTNIDNLTDNLGDMIETIKGFKVKINTFLYQLEWDDETAQLFYQERYAAYPDSIKRNAFENGRGEYKLKYIGKVESTGNQTSFMGINEDQPNLMVRKACQRAIDENIVDLQKKYDTFRTKTPIVTDSPITAYIGMKEGVNSRSRFEVLEKVLSEDGKINYNRVAVIAPIENLIWDNRFMAKEENSPTASLGFTTFKKVSGKEVLKGMLIREITK